MGRENVALVAFNRGRISRLALARTDIKRVALSADLMTNWMPRVLGSMMLRPGFGYVGAVEPSTDAAPRYIPFVFATDDTALLEIVSAPSGTPGGGGSLRIWVDDAVLTRSAVTATITNGQFDTDLSGWTSLDESGSTSAWAAGSNMGLTGNGTTNAIREQAIAITPGEEAIEHGLFIIIGRGPVKCRIGTTSGGEELLRETDLATGAHSFGITPGASTIYLRFFSHLKRLVLVHDVEFESAAPLNLPTPYNDEDLGRIRFDQSADVVYLACYGQQQHKVERRATRSWSFVRYQTNDGPLRIPNVRPITITPSALSGNITLGASSALFTESMAGSDSAFDGKDGALFRISSNGQNVSTTVTAQNTFTNAILVEGIDTQRVFTPTMTGLTATGSTITLQRSLVSDSGPWTDITSFVADSSTPFDDGLDNQLAWYRLGCKTGGYVLGTIAIALAYTVGSIDGFVRITSYTSSVLVNAEVIKDLGSTDATDDWAEGEWSDQRGWPSAVALFDGRLWWSGKQGIWGSISDGFESFDETVEGDSAPINRDVGSGPLDRINWMLPISRLVLGGQGAELSCKSSSLDEPLTPTNFQIKPDSTQGSSEVGAARIDSRGVFVQNGGTRVFELSRGDGVDYTAIDLTVMIPEVCSAGVTRLAVQRKPDTRIHCVLADGTVAVAIYDRVEQVICWIDIATREGDEIEDVVILPGLDGTGEDQVYYAVKRVVNGVEVRHLEKWALESECIGEALNKQADAFIVYTGAATVTIPAAHLIGEEVVAWTNGTCPEDADGEIQTYTVDGSGNVTLSTAATNVVIGLSYTSQWRSTKLAYAAQNGSALNQRKNLDHLGVILDRTHHKGLKYGQDFDHLSPMPEVERGAVVPSGTIHSHYDEDAFELGGQWSTDSRLCLQAEAPRPCTLLAATLPIEEHSKS